MSVKNDGYLTKEVHQKRQKKQDRRRLGEDAETGRHARISFKKYLQELEDETIDDALLEEDDD